MHTGKTGASYGLRLLALSHYRWASMAFILQSPKPLKTIDIHPSILGLPHPVLLIWGVTLCGMSWVLQGVEPHHLLNARFPSPGDHRCLWGRITPSETPWSMGENRCEGVHDGTPMEWHGWPTSPSAPHLARWEHCHTQC